MKHLLVQNVYDIGKISFIKIKNRHLFRKRTKIKNLYTHLSDINEMSSMICVMIYSQSSEETIGTSLKCAKYLIVYSYYT